MTDFKVIVIGGSAGAIEVLMRTAMQFPADWNAAVFVTIHISPAAPSSLPRMLGRNARMAASHARDNEMIKPGHIYVAPPDYHLLIEDGYMRLGRGPRENGHRPALDTMFRTAALAYGPRVIGVVLSGNLDDGASGLRIIRQAGGKSIVQDPDDALYDGMPLTALDEAGADVVAKADEIGAAIVAMAGGETARTISIRNETHMKLDDRKDGELVPFGCPDCGGTLWETKDGDVVHYRCRVGHAYSDESLLAAQNEGLERAMWTALRALEEMTSNANRLAERMRRRGHRLVAERFQQRADESEQRAGIIRGALLELDPQTTDNGLQEVS